MTHEHPYSKTHPVIIVWRDSYGYSGWKSLADLDCDVGSIVTIGFVISETDHTLMVAPTISAFEQFYSPLIIPKENICERKRITLPQISPERWSKRGP